LLGKPLVAHNNKTFRKGFRGIDPNNANISCSEGIKVGEKY